MRYRVNAGVQRIVPPPIATIKDWVVPPLDDRPVIDLAQAVPSHPPAAALSAYLGEVLLAGDLHLYTDILGAPSLRGAYARHLSDHYAGTVEASEVAITAGCNMAFCTALMTLAQPGDEVVLATPHYFNHRMWLDMLGVRAVPLPVAEDGLPSVDRAAGLVSERTKACVLVTPNNPTGAIYPPFIIDAFFDLCQEEGIALVLDETYKDFLPHDGPPHALLGRPDWQDTLIHLYSFSKAYALAGFRVGAIAASESFLDQAEKVMDTTLIAAPAIAQEAAWWALDHLQGWKRDRRDDLGRRLAAFRSAMAAPDLAYTIASAGAYFAYVKHPFEGIGADQVVRHLAQDHGLSCLPGTAFGPGQGQYLRLAFANVPEARMAEIADRLIASQAALGLEG